MPRNLGVFKQRRWAFPSREVYRAWIDPTLRVPPVVEMEASVQPGGALLIVLNSGGSRSELRGEYLEVIPGRRLRYTWIWSEVGEETIVNVAFEALDGGSRLTLVHEGFSSAVQRDAHALAWEAYLRLLAQELSRRTGLVSDATASAGPLAR